MGFSRHDSETGCKLLQIQLARRIGRSRVLVRGLVVIKCLLCSAYPFSLFVDAAGRLVDLISRRHLLLQMVTKLRKATGVESPKEG